ncbi:hypothetical protein ASD11_14755 [Aeromicrobium sp. Root495]|uniref:hypothetical protein n=1 Tax=Aeromicrobium sp. Root495 TaxID=1736550 RepID=UPI0006F5F7A8|nr:hypothetical protein [Aeromicrobium sp. Root495]KQY55765.1 hypothetical protein ASD11_14755 [Aeromicrobium sp. Root495]
MLMTAAFVVSVVHYVDNVANYADYPDASGGPVPAPSAALIAVSWFVFTAAGIVGVLAYRAGRTSVAAVGLAVYSGSGIIGIGHYTVAGATDMVWWRQAHVVADILLGFAVLGFALWVATRGRRPGPVAR